MLKKVLLSVVILLAIALALQNPWALVEQREETRELVKAVERLEAENKALGQKIKEFDDPKNIELLAREKLGLVKQGERVYVVITADAGSGDTTVTSDSSGGSTIDASATGDATSLITGSTTSDEEASVGDGSWYQRILEFLGFIPAATDP